MATIPKPTYFLAPHCDFPPDGLIALGSIIVNPKTPQKSLNYRNNQRVAVSANELQESFKENWEDVVKSASHNKITLWASFLQMIMGVGADISAGLKQGREDLYKFRRLETRFFEPGVAYIEESLKGEGVKAYISATRCKKPIYMITGVKIARGAMVTGKTVKSYQGMLKVSVGATALTGVPVSGWPKIDTSNTKERGVRFESSSDYVFAYRVVKIQLNKDSSVKRYEDYNKGAFFFVDEEKPVGEGDLVSEDWDVEELVATSEEFQGSNTVSEVYEDEEDVVVLVVNP
jgi:hypothetical protein